MNLAGNTILITGGASGIGLAFTERFLAAGNEVIVCGRREDKLLAAKAKHPQIHTRVCDVANESERIELFKWTTGKFPAINVLINNAGIQRRINLPENENWEKTRSEIAINFEAPIHLSRLFIPYFLKQQNPSIFNVTSGLSFVPLANVPVYSATKAALHSFTLSLRHQLAETPIRIVEVAPPAVDTDLGGVGWHTFGINVNEFADAVFARLANGETEIAYGSAEKASRASYEEQKEIFNSLNRNSNQ